jgi:hypothetical protein
MRKYTIEQVQGTGSDRNKIMHLVKGSNPYHAYRQFETMQGLKKVWQTDDIGTANNPCVRFIIGKPGPDQLLFYVKPKTD